MPDLSHAVRFTVADYLGWPGSPDCELVDGVQSTLPFTQEVRHQEVVFAIYQHFLGLQLATDGPLSTAYIGLGPVELVLGEATLLQPDLIVDRRRDRVRDGRYFDGAPELVVEVLGSATAVRDLGVKLELYEQFGVQEYLVVDPHNNYLAHHRLVAGRYPRPMLFTPDTPLELALLPGLPQAIHAWFGQREESGIEI